MRKIKYLFTILILAAFMTGCGEEKSEAVTGSAPAAAENKENEAPAKTQEESVESKRAKFEELYRENEALWNEYLSTFEEIVYYDAVRQEEIAREEYFESARDKLDKRPEDNPVWIRPGKDFTLPAEEVEIPEVLNADLDKWITDLTQQNNDIKKQTEALMPTLRAYRQTYGATKGLDGLKYIEIDEEAVKAAKEVDTGAPGNQTSSGSSGDKASSEGAGGGSKGGNYDTSMTVEEMLRKAGWDIVSGSGDAVEAHIKKGGDMIMIITNGEDYGFTMRNESLEYGEVSGVFGGCDVSKQREIVAYICNNGTKAFWYADFGVDWTPFN